MINSIPDVPYSEFELCRNRKIKDHRGNAAVILRLTVDDGRNDSGNL